MLEVGTEFSASKSVALDGVIFVKLADGRGWVFESKAAEPSDKRPKGGTGADHDGRLRILELLRVATTADIDAQGSAGAEHGGASLGDREAGSAASAGIGGADARAGNTAGGALAGGGDSLPPSWSGGSMADDGDDGGGADGAQMSTSEKVLQMMDGGVVGRSSAGAAARRAKTLRGKSPRPPARGGAHPDSAAAPGGDFAAGAAGGGDSARVYQMQVSLELPTPSLRHGDCKRRCHHPMTKTGWGALPMTDHPFGARWTRRYRSSTVLCARARARARARVAREHVHARASCARLV